MWIKIHWSWNLKKYEIVFEKLERGGEIYWKLQLRNNWNWTLEFLKLQLLQGVSNRWVELEWKKKVRFLWKIVISIIIEDYIIPVNFNNINANIIAINWTDAFKNNTLIQRNDEHSRIAIKKKRVLHFLTQLIPHDGSSRNRERKGDFSVTPNKCNDLHSGIAIKRNGTAFF